MKQTTNTPTTQKITGYTSAPYELVQAVIDTTGEEIFEYPQDYRDASVGVSGFIYYNDTLQFATTYKEEILNMLKADAEEYGFDNVFSMISNFNCINLSAEEVAEGLYNDESDNKAEVYNALAWSALENVANAIVMLKECNDY